MNCSPVTFTVYVYNEIMHVNPQESIRNMLKKCLTDVFLLWVAFFKVPNTPDVFFQRDMT